MKTTAGGERSTLLISSGLTSTFVAQFPIAFAFYSGYGFKRFLCVFILNFPVSLLIRFYYPLIPSISASGNTFNNNPQTLIFIPAYSWSYSKDYVYVSSSYWLDAICVYFERFCCFIHFSLSFIYN